MPIRVVVVTCLSMLAAAAAAQPSPQTRAKAAPGAVVEYEFPPEALTGRTQRPEGAVEVVRRRSSQGSLIRTRAHFRDRLLQSAETL